MSIHRGSEKRRSPTLEARPLLFEAYHPYVEIVVGTDLGRGNGAVLARERARATASNGSPVTSIPITITLSA
jgi:hypothetical protein